VTLLRTKGLARAFGGVRAVDGVDLELARGEILGVIGPNGAGKTTLINCISGFFKPTGGDIFLGEDRVTDWPGFRRSRAGLVRTFQTPRLFDEAGAIENVIAGGYRQRPYSLTGGLFGARKRAHEKMVERAGAALRDIGLSESQWKRPTSELGHGERRLVELARAVAAGPDVLCLDEPTAGLNESESVGFAAWMRERVEQGVGVLLVSHDMRLVMGTCHRVLVLDFGRPVAEGDPATVRTDPQVIAVYLGEGSA
jgi:branched-chain amino acid transport system ATP-binding protein